MCTAQEEKNSRVCACVRACMCLQLEYLPFVKCIIKHYKQYCSQVKKRTLVLAERKENWHWLRGKKLLIGTGSEEREHQLVPAQKVKMCIKKDQNKWMDLWRQFDTWHASWIQTPILQSSFSLTLCIELFAICGVTSYQNVLTKIKQPPLNKKHDVEQDDSFYISVCVYTNCFHTHTHTHIKNRNFFFF